MMNYTISKQRLVEVMKKFYEETNKKPLPIINRISRRTHTFNKGYGSPMHDYITFSFEYIDENDKTLFLKNGEPPRFLTANWYVSDQLESLYNFFGEEEFEMFVEIVYKLDIRNAEEYDSNWVFTEG